jgi:hypothetical protein
MIIVDYNKSVSIIIGYYQVKCFSGEARNYYGGTLYDGTRFVVT